MRMSYVDHPTSFVAHSPHQLLLMMRMSHKSSRMSDKTSLDGEGCLLPVKLRPQRGFAVHLRSASLLKVFGLEGFTHFNLILTQYSFLFLKYGLESYQQKIEYYFLCPLT